MYHQLRGLIFNNYNNPYILTMKQPNLNIIERIFYVFTFILAGFSSVAYLCDGAAKPLLVTAFCLFIITSCYIFIKIKGLSYSGLYDSITKVYHKYKNLYLFFSLRGNVTNAIWNLKSIKFFPRVRIQTSRWRN